MLGRVAVTCHASQETASLAAFGANIVLEPFQDAADQAVDLLCGSAQPDRISISDVEDKDT